MVAVLAVLSGCQSQAKIEKPQPTSSATAPRALCDRLMPGGDVAALLGSVSLEDSVSRKPSQGDFAFTCSVHAGREEVLTYAESADTNDGAAAFLPNRVDASAAPLGSGIEGMVDDGEAWLIQPCMISGHRQHMFVDVKTTSPASDKRKPHQRVELGRLVVTVANGVADKAGCGMKPIDLPSTMAPAPTPRPIDAASRVCGFLDGREVVAALGVPQEWTAVATPRRPTPIDVCELDKNASRGILMSTSYGTLATNADHLVLDHDTKPLGRLPGKGAVGPRGAWLDTTCRGKRIAYRLNVVHNAASPGVDGIEKLFRAFVRASSQRDGCPIG